MKLYSLLLVLLGTIFPLLACGETNFLEQIKTSELPLSKLREYALSLDEGAMLRLANDAFVQGWDPYAVTIGILGPYYETKGIVCTTETKLAILKDPTMHPEFREHIAAWGLKDRSLDLDGFLKYVDELLNLFEDTTIHYFYKQGIPGGVIERLQGKAEDIRKQPDENGGKSQALGKLHSRGIRMMSDLVSYLETDPKPSEDREGYSGAPSAVACLSKYVNWYLSEDGPPTEATQKRLDAVRRAQTEFIAILNDPTYDPAAARTVLRLAEESGLDQALSTDTVAKIKKDARFSGEEDQRLLDALHQRIQAKRGP